MKPEQNVFFGRSFFPGTLYEDYEENFYSSLWSWYKMLPTVFAFMNSNITSQIQNMLKILIDKILVTKILRKS